MARRSTRPIPDLEEHSSEMIEDFGFGLPMVLPIWRSGRSGPWNVTRHPRRTFNPSYLAPSCVDPAGPVLDHVDGTTWMNFGMLELESHAWHLHKARGTVVVGGLGLGMFTASCAAKEEVERVVVIERDADVVNLFRTCTDFEESDWGRKVTIVEADVMSTELPSILRASGVGHVDHLYMDIWPSYPMPSAIRDTAAVVAMLKPTEASWWGQEAAYGLWCEARRKPMDEDSLEIWERRCGLPSIYGAAYLKFCITVAEGHAFDIPGLDTRNVDSAAA